jgi:hypothetical protein
LGSSVLALAPATAKAVGTIANNITNCSRSDSCIVGSNTGSGSGVSGDSVKASGVVGRSQAADNAGVIGSNFTSGGTGVLGEGSNAGNFYVTDQNFGVAVDGTLPSNAYSGYAFFGNDASAAGGYGILTQSSHGVAAEFDNIAGNDRDTMDMFGGANYRDPKNSSFLINAFTNDDVQIFTLDSYGNINLDGTIYTNGSCQNGCAKSKVRSYTPHESEPTMEDVGEAKLLAGSANVALDSAFRNVVNSDARYTVQITPEGASKGLYVAQRTSRGFVVQENPPGHSSLPFSYRIIAKPFGENGARLPMIANAVKKPARLPRPSATVHR